MKTKAKVQMIVYVDVDITGMAIPKEWLEPDYDVETIRIPLQLYQMAVEAVWAEKVLISKADTKIVNVIQEEE